MRVSLNFIKQYTEVNLPVDDLVNKINTQLGGVEEVASLGERYHGAVIVRVVTCEQHPNADRLSVCMIDDRGAVDGVKRDGDGLVQIVCGAPNVSPDMLAVWLPPGMVVPASFGTPEAFTLSARELRGVTSNGMLAAGDELAINNDHDGIIEIRQTDLKEIDDLDSIIGKNFAEIFELNDTLIDIENKMFTHRPDLFGQLGVAREVAGIQGLKFTSPEWYWKLPPFAPHYNDNKVVSDDEELSLETFNNASEKAPRFMSVVIKDVEVAKSPLWLQCELLRLGLKSINNIVDITNYIMLLTAQPVHAYDYDKIRGKKIGVRLANDGEAINLLNGKTYRLDEDDIVISDSEGPIGLAGIMGGGESEVTNETTNVVLEVASFDMFSVRKTSMRHGIFTDAVTRFNKGQSPLQTDRVMHRLIEMILSITGGSQASLVSDDIDFKAELYNNQSLKYELNVPSAFINDRLGLDLSDDQICSLLKSVEFAAFKQEGSSDIRISAPFWRTDIELPEDIVEEVGRLYGFDKLPRELPKRSIQPAPKNVMLELKNSMRDILSSAGVNEVLTYSFVHENTLLKAQQNPTDAYRITNSLSPDLQYYRQSLTPSLLSNIHANIKAGNDSFALFEVGKGHLKSLSVNHEGVPIELNQLAFTYSSKNDDSGTAFFLAKRYLELVMKSLNLSTLVRPLGDIDQTAITAPFEPKRSAAVVDLQTGEYIGVVGEYKKRVSNEFKLPVRTSGFEISIDAILPLLKISQNSTYMPLSRYPSLTRDVCFKVKADVSYDKLRNAIEINHSKDIDIKIMPIDIYQSPEDSDYKQITFRVVMRNYEKTMNSEEAEVILQDMISTAQELVHASVV